MLPPDFPSDEAHRLQALNQAGLLDSASEERFDRITRLAANFFGVQVCLFSLVDSSRQWFKSKTGLDVEETGRDVSFCGHAILQNDLLIINDAKDDYRFADNPLVVGAPYIRFYAGAPVHEPTGKVIGTLCLIDPYPRDLSITQRQHLREFAELLEHEVARLNEIQQQTLININDRATSILMTIPDMVFVVNRDYVFVMCNDHSDLLKPRDEIIGHHIHEVLPVAFGDLLRHYIDKAFVTDGIVYHYYELDGTDQTFEARFRAVNANEVLVIIRNTTVQTQAAAEVKRLSEVARQTTNGVVITDLEGLVVWSNESFTKITGYTLPELLGKKPGSMLQGPDTEPDTIQIMRESLRLQKSFNVDVLNYSKEKKPYWVRISCSPMWSEQGELTGFIAIETDITKEKKDEEIIRNSDNLLKAVDFPQSHRHSVTSLRLALAS